MRVLHVLDPVAWSVAGSRGSRRTKRHLIGYTGLPPAYSGARTVCGQPIPVTALLESPATCPPCLFCQRQLEQRGAAFYEHRQKDWTVRDRGLLSDPSMDHERNPGNDGGDARDTRGG